jgi:hypothetical protein
MYEQNEMYYITYTSFPKVNEEKIVRSSKYLDSPGGKFSYK